MNPKIIYIINWILAILPIIFIPFYVYQIYWCIAVGDIFSIIFDSLFLALAVLLFVFYTIPFLKQKLPDRHYFTRMKLSNKLNKIKCKLGYHRWINGRIMDYSVPEEYKDVKICKRCKVFEGKMSINFKPSEIAKRASYIQWDEPLE